MPKSLEEQARSMAGLAPKRGLAHPWWMVAKAALAILEDPQYADAAQRMREVYESRESTG